VPEYNEDKKQKILTRFAFILLYLQLGCMYALTTWNAREMDRGNGGFMADHFVGIYTDFNAYWFADVGKFFVKAMFINGLWPFIEFGMYGTMQKMKIMIDQ
jgi:hypothetical protein